MSNHPLIFENCSIVELGKKGNLRIAQSTILLTGSPELIVEVLSPGKQNIRRDKEAKLKLYSVQGVREYWIVDRFTKQVEVYRRENARLVLVATLLGDEQITSPLLPGFCCSIRCFFPQ